MNRKHIFIIALIALSLTAQGQTSLDKYLEMVVANNQSIKTNNLVFQYKSEQAKTGNTPDNPEINYGYFPGNSDALGVKEVFEVSQKFDFPTSYIHKSKMATQNANIANEAYRLASQEILLNAWECWALAIYNNKKLQVLTERKNEAQKLLNNYLKKQENGDATQLAVNKARLFYIDTQNKLRLHNSSAKQNSEALKQLNGGIEYTVTDSMFTPVILETWEALKVKLQNMHPEIGIAEQNKILADNGLKLSKSNWLPSFTVGYESEDVMGDKYRGIRGGVSVPLWKEKNAISTQKINVELSQQSIDETMLNIVSKYHQKYLYVEALNDNFNEFNKSLNSMNNNYLLHRSLELGQISAIEYFMELNYFYEVSDELMDLELEFQLNLAQLYDFTLVE